MRYQPVAALVASILALMLVAPSANADIVNVPPLTIHSLTHRLYNQWVQDCIFIPGPGYSSSGFSASYSTGDVVRVRIQAPTGKMFRVHAAPGGTVVSFSVYWACAGGPSSHLNPANVTFENLTGIAPTNTYWLAFANEFLVEAWFIYTASADFEFTAFVADISVDQPLASTVRTYGEAGSYAAPSISASAANVDPSFHPMEIVDTGPVPVRVSSWGRIKTLYR